MMVSDMRVMGRATQGVKLIRLDENDQIADIAVIPHNENEDKSEEEAAIALENGAETANESGVKGEEE